MTIAYQKSFSKSLFLDGEAMRGVLFGMASLDTYTDEALLRCSLKNPRAFSVLVDRYQALFLKRALFVLKNRDDAEDVVQDAFVRIYRFASRFSEEAGTFSSWATTILMNVARARYQKRMREWLRVAPLSPEHYESLPDASGGEALIRDAVARLLERAPPEVARLIRRVYFEGKNYEEIAREEGMSVGSIKTRVHRAKKTLRHLVDKMEVF